MKRYAIGFLIALVTALEAFAAPANTTFTYPPWKHTWGVRRATPTKLRIFVGNKTKFNDPQGLVCVRLEAWENPETTADDDEVTVYGVNSGDNCIIYNRSMYSLGIYGLDADHEHFNRPWGITADSQGNVFVVDRGNSRIVRLFNPGDGLVYVNEFGHVGTKSGEFIDPRGIAMDTEERLYITDNSLDRITVTDMLGHAIDLWVGFSGPDGIAVIGPADTCSYYRDSFAVIIDSLHQRITKTDLSGQIIARIRTDELGIEEAHLNYAVIDYNSNIILTDSKNGCLIKLDKDLNLLTIFGKLGLKDYQFDEPRGIALNRYLGQLFVAERQGAQYFWVAVDVRDFTAYVKISGKWKDLIVDFFLTEPALAEIDVMDKSGHFLARIANNRRFPSGHTHLSWSMNIPDRSPDGKPLPALPKKYTRGKLLPPGKYTLRARFRAVYSSREHFTREAEADFEVGN